MMTLRRTLSLVVPAVVVAAVATLPACSDDEPSAETSLSAATTSTAPPSTTGPPSATSSTFPSTTGPPTTPPPAGATTSSNSSSSSSSSSEPPVDERVATPADAVALWVIGQGQQYAGDCASTTPDDIGKVCSIQYASIGADVVFVVGPTFSEFATYLRVSEEASGWYVADTAPAGGGVPPPW